MDNINKFLLCKHRLEDLQEEEEEEGERFYFALHNDSEELFQEYYEITSPLNLLQAHACNGLVCYNTSDDPHSLYLWNPIIRKVKKLPNPINHLYINNDDIDQAHRVFKLWFDSEVNDYKILRIAYTAKTYSTVVEVFSLSTNSWKLIIIDDAPVLAPASFTYIDRLVYVNGTFYWPALKNHKWIINSIETKSWIFREISTEMQARVLYFAQSNQHDDSLVIIGCGNMDGCFYDRIEGCTVFVFRVYMYTTDELCNSVNIIGDDHRIEHLQTPYWPDIGTLLDRGPLGVRNNGELLFQDHMSFRIFSYDIKSKKLMEFDSLTKADQCTLQVTPFVQTLALLDHTDAYGI